jgi:hypothetical protein
MRATYTAHLILLHLICLIIILHQDKINWHVGSPTEQSWHVVRAPVARQKAPYRPKTSSLMLM